MTKKELLQSLFYDLLRDGAPAGDVEHAVSELETLCFGRASPEFISYTNKHLAAYADELAARVLGAIEKKAVKNEADTTVERRAGASGRRGATRRS